MSRKTDDSGTGRRILIVEDEFYIAADLAASLEDMGFRVVGPVPSIPKALALIAVERLDGALLDANLNGVSSGPIADALVERGIPFVVVTGYGSGDLLTDRLSKAPRMTKPWEPSDMKTLMRTVFLG